MTREMFVGRVPELEIISRAVAAAADGRSSLVWIEGPAGSGKSALVRRAVAEAPVDVLSVTAEEVAMDVAFALVDQFGVEHDAHPFSTGLILLDAFARRCGNAPSLVVVEDLHWADAASCQALLTAARRFDRDGIVLMLTARPGTVLADGWDRLQDTDAIVVELTPLTVDEISELAAQLGVRLSGTRAAEIHGHTLGHALHVRTVLAELAIADARQPGAPLPVPSTLAATVNAKVRAMDEGGQRLAAALAVLNRRVPLAVAAGVGEVSAPGSALEELLAGDIVVWEPTVAGTPIAFAHPLFQSAVYESLTPTVRQRLHSAASERVDGDAALIHRAAAADGFDDDVADALVVAAADAERRGQNTTAAAHLLGGSTLTRSQAASETRLLRAAQLFLEAGLTGRVTAVEDRIVACRPAPRRALVLGQLAVHRADAAGAEKWLREASVAADSSVAGAALAALTTLYGFHSRGADCLAAGEALVALDDVDEPLNRQGWWAIAIGEAQSHGPQRALDRLAQRLPASVADVDDTDVLLLIARGIIGCHAGAISGPLADLEAVAGSGQDHGPRPHLHLAQALHRAGRWDEAITQARVARSLADMREVWILAPIEATLAQILADRGDAAADSHLAAARDISATARSGEARAAVAMAAAATAFARGEPSGVIEQVGPIADAEAQGRANPMMSLAWWPMLVIARLEQGDANGATEERERFRTAVARRGLVLEAQQAVLDARLAAAAHRPDALDAFAHAMSLAHLDLPALERALLHQAYGEAMHAAGDRRGAADQLGSARTMLDRLGAAPFQARLDASLPSRRGRPVRSRTQRRFMLTDRESDVATLVATGMTNKEVAAHLYVSAKAVEYHLSNIFAKLGLSSRRELRQRQSELLGST